jgi:hypothetical protein
MNGIPESCMSAFFDTNIVIDLLAGHPPALNEAASHAEVAFHA